MSSASTQTPQVEKQLLNLIETVGREFYWPHLLFAVTIIFLVPLVTGFYVGRHSMRNRYRNVGLTVAIVLLFGPIKDFLFDSYEITSSFVWTFVWTFFKLYLLFPFFFIIALLGALGGSLMLSPNDNGLYISIFRDLRNKRKRGYIYLFFVLFAFLLSVGKIEKGIEEFLTPYFQHFYAPVSFNKNPKDLPLLKIADVSNPFADKNWTDSIQLNNEDSFALLFYYNNNSYLYRAKNTKLALKQSDAKYTAVLWADNARTIQDSVALLYQCNKPLFTYINSNWYPNRPINNQSRPLPSGQTGQGILTPNGIDLGDVEGMWIGQGFFVVSFKYNCLD